MSTLKTTNLQNADASSANIVLGQGSGGGATIAGVTTVTGSLVASGGVDASATTVTANQVTLSTDIVHSGDTDTKIRFPTTDAVSVETAGSEAARIDSSQRLLVGHTSSHADLHGKIQIAGAASQSLDVARYTANAHPPYINLFKSRNASTGGNTVVQADDTVGYISAAGNDGSGFHSAAGIAFRIDGTPGDNDMPGRIDFETVSDDGTTLTNRLTISSGGIIKCGTSGTLKAEINNAVSGHQFISQCSDNNNGFEVYQQHGSTATRNTFAAYDNRGGSGAKQLAFAVRGDGLTVHQGAICMNSETSAANQLDDYEEGSWTPLVHDAAGSNISITGNTGNYTKIGNFVNLSFELQFDETGSKNGGAMWFHGLPFSPNANYKASGNWWYDGGGTSVDKTGGGVYVSTSGSGKYLLKQCVNSNAQPSDDYLRWNDVSNSRYVYCTAFYRV